jgi:hypothetical protein
VDRLELIDGGRYDSIDHLRKYLSNGQARNGNDATSPLFILRPYVSDVSAPIEASSDAEAIFELLYQTRDDDDLTA